MESLLDVHDGRLRAHRLTVRSDVADRRAPVGGHRSADRRFLHPWVDVGHPTTATGEGAFIDQLRSIAACSSPRSAVRFDRTEVTALINGLRCGLGAIELLRRAPGLVPGCLVAAYDEIERRRQAAEQAWNAILAHPTAEAIEDHGRIAIQLLPTVITDLTARARAGDALLDARVRRAAKEVLRVSRIASRIEMWMDDPSRSAANRARFGRLLHNLEEPGLWAHEYFLAPRVGALSPLRLSALLGEQSSLTNAWADTGSADLALAIRSEPRTTVAAH